jgi:hypothetical protein
MTLLLFAGAVCGGMYGATQAGCVSSLDCSLNGDCDAKTGRCECDPGWRGRGCASLDLALQTADAMLNETNRSTWGAPAVFSEGAYHAYVSEMVEGCGITSWQSNSQLTHYTAQTPRGPWQRKDVAVPVWAHCATAAAVPNKTGTTLIMTHMSRRAGARKCLPSGCCQGGASPCGMKHPCNASSHAAPAPAGPVRAGEGTPHKDGTLPIKYAHSPDGPWMQTSVEVRNLSTFFLAAPLVLPNGTAFMVVETPPLSTLLRAETWRGPYSVVTRAACGGGEGASLWADKAGRGLHCMYHRAPFNASSKDGGHSFSADGVNWYCARKADGKHTPCHAAEGGDAESLPMYGSSIAFEGGGLVSYGTRERPHAVMDSDGSLVAVSSSLELCAPLSPAGDSSAWSNPGPYSQCTNRWPGYNDRTWTSILPVKTDDVFTASASSGGGAPHHYAYERGGSKGLDGDRIWYVAVPYGLLKSDDDDSALPRTAECSAARAVLAKSQAFALQAAAVDAVATAVLARASAECAAAATPCNYNGTAASCRDEYFFDGRNATMCFHQTISEWKPYAQLLRSMEAAGNATLGDPGGENLWENRAVASVDPARPQLAALRILGLARPIYTPEACLDVDDLYELTNSLNSACRQNASNVYCNVGVQRYPDPSAIHTSTVNPPTAVKPLRQDTPAAAGPLRQQRRRQHRMSPTVVVSTARGGSKGSNNSSSNPFAMCGFGESGAPVFAGEGDSPFGVGSSQWCCGNTTWSSFSWRARATRNVEFTLAALSAPIPTGGLSNATECHLHGSKATDCFGFCFNTTHNKACENYTAADEWSSWRDFTPSAQAPSAHPPHPMSTVAAHYCGSYPNEFLDPIKHLVLKLNIRGVWFGNFSNITLEVRPGGAHAGKIPVYRLHTQVAHLSSGFGKNNGAQKAWPKLPTGGSMVLTAPFMVARENLTKEENAGTPVQPLVTEREHSATLWGVLPSVPKPPKKIVVVQGYHGENDVQGWRDAARALVSFGTTGMGGTASAPLRQILEEAGITATRHQGSISGNIAHLNTSCRPSTETDHCWGTTDADVAANLKLWAQTIVGPLKLAGVKKLTQFALHDELGWSYPKIWAGAENVSGNPFVFARFHQYIQNKSGLTTPESFGATTWADVVPISTANLTNVSSKHIQGLQNRLYWSMRFAAWDVTAFYSKATAALVAANDGKAFSIYTNCNNFHGRSRSPAKPPRVQPGTGVMVAQSDRQGMDWFEAGRLRAGTMLWTEDWFDDTAASEWSYLAARMRCAARLGGPDVQFGGYIVPRGPTGTAPRGTIGLLKKAVALIGGGAKGMDYFEFGPEPMFPGNCFTAVAMRDPNHTMFTLIAEANRMIATADDLLYDGKMPVAEVAVLYPRSSWFWDNSSGITGACSNQPAGAKCKKLTPACIATIDLYCASQAPLQCSTCLSAWPRQLAESGCPADNETLMTYCQELGPAGPSSCEDQGATTMAYMGSIYGMFRYISQVHNVQLDFIDEDSLTAEDLQAFKALIITEPDIPTEGLVALADWVQAGGHLLTTAGAAAYDRYHRPSTVLSAVTGFVEAPHERLMVQWSALLKVAATGVGELGAIEAYGVRSNLKSFGARDFQQLAAFADGTPAIARNSAVGKGSATHFAFHPSLRFPNMNPYTGTLNFDQFENFNDGTLPYLAEFLDNAGVKARVKVSSQQVETPLLISTGGAVVTLLDWRPESQQFPLINVTVRLDFDITEVTAVRAGVKLQFTSVRQGDEFVISFSTELEHCDFITLEAKQDTATTTFKSDDDRTWTPILPVKTDDEPTAADAPSPPSSSCVNTSWSSFSWRVKVSELYEYPAGSGANLSAVPFYHTLLAFPATARPEEKNRTVANQWGAWWEFTPANATQSCAHYPNSLLYQRSWTKLVLELEVYGIPLGAGANVTLQIQPRGTRAAEPPYEIVSRAAHLKIELEWSSKAWPHPPNNPSVYLTYILAAADSVALRALEPERLANRAYWRAMPAVGAAVQSPRQLQIVQGYHGQDDIDGWAEASAAIKRLGANGLRGYPSAGVQALLQDQGKWPFVSTLGNLLGGYGPGLSGSTNVDGQGASWWGGTEEQLQANLTRWAASKLGPFRAAGFKGGLAQVAIHDEPEWHLPAERNVSAATAASLKRAPGPFGFRFDLPRSVPHYQLQRWESFLTANNVTLKMLGATSWDQALPVSRYNLSTTADDVSPEATALKMRYYWGLRFYSFSATTFYSKVTAALVKEMGQGPLTVYTNYKCALALPFATYIIAFVAQTCN